MTMTFKTAALALVAPALFAAAVPALADDHDYGRPGWSQHQDSWNHSDRGRHRGWNNNNRGGNGYGNSGYDRGYNDRGYNDRSYDEPVYRNTSVWRGDDGRTYCRRSNGTTGLLIGGVIGGVIGNEVAGRRGDRTLGAILGAGIGALAGREIDRSGSRCR